MKRTPVAGIVAILAVGFAFIASAQIRAAQQEISTAHAHALMAQRANTVATGHTHLQHVINCLVGPKGVGFDAAAGVPCKDQGNGAIPDSASDGALGGKLKAALADAQAGLKASSLASLHRDAAKAAAALEATPAQKASGAYSW